MRCIISLLEDFMTRHGSHYRQFYVGIARDPVMRLADGHNVDDSVPHIYFENGPDTALVRSIERYFISKGTRGGPGGGDETTRAIYIYLITPKTRE